jgi:tRNA pseudouridine55 synthase
VSAAFGFLNAFKPPGPSSAAFGTWVKARAGTAVGHWGTLDPQACGVLVLGIGKATRLLPLISDTSKRYVFELVVGEQTDSGDAAGTVIARAEVPADWKRGLPAAAGSLIGQIEHVAPMHSARKVGGTPLYRHARAGVIIPRPARTTTIHRLEILGAQPDARRARLFVHCDAGTYVRVICEDLGRALGLPARMGALLRVGAGPFDIENAITPSRIDASFAECLIDPLDVLGNPRVELDAAQARRFRFGNDIRLDGIDGIQTHDDVLVVHERELLGIGRVVTAGGSSVLAPARVLVAAAQGS